MEIPKEYKIRNQIWIESDMYYSEAWHALGKSASLINTLLRCLQKRKWENQKINRKNVRIYTNDGFTFPYHEAAGLKIAGTTQHWKNLRKLVEVGFLDPVHQGGWYKKHEKTKDYSVYKFSDRWRAYGTPDFKEIKMPKVLPKYFHILENIKRQKTKVTSLKRRHDLHSNEDDKTMAENISLHANEDDTAEGKGRQTLAVSA